MCGSLRLFLWDWDGVLVVCFLVSPHTSLSSKEKTFGKIRVASGTFVSLWGLGLAWREEFEANTKTCEVMQKHSVTTLATSMPPAQLFGVSEMLVVDSFVTELVFVLYFYQTYLQILFVYVGKGVLGVGMGKSKLPLIVFCIIICKRHNKSCAFVNCTHFSLAVF